MQPYGHKPYYDYCRKTCYDSNLSVKTNRLTYIINHTAENAGHSINLFSEYQWHFVNKHIAYHSAGGTGYAPHYDCHPKRESLIKSFLQTCHGKQCKPQRVEQEPSAGKLHNHLLEHNDRNQRHGSTYHVNGVSHPERRNTEHHVSDCTATYSSGQTYNVTAEPVEILGRSPAYA